jgi:hypothetical protein
MPVNVAKKWTADTPAHVKNESGWVSSGEITESTVIKATPGVLGGVLVTIDDAEGDGVVLIYDSPDDTTTDDEIVARITVIETTANAQNSFAAPSREGVLCTKGIFCHITGDLHVSVYYK